MKKLIFMLTTVIALSFVVSSCKKYEDGPTFSLASKKSRAAHTWKMEKEYLNGVEQILSTRDSTYRLTLDISGSVSSSSIYGSITTNNTGTWEFANDYDDIQTTMRLTGNIIIVTQYKILRLKSKELWMEETKSNGDVYEYRLASV